MPTIQFKSLMKSSALLAVKRQEKWGCVLFSFGRLCAFCDPISKKIFILDPIQWKTMHRHIADWIQKIIAADSIPDIKDFETIKVPEERVEILFDEFLRFT